jgi:hypothetical protein
MNNDNSNSAETKKNRLNLFLSETFEQDKFSQRESHSEGNFILEFLFRK